MAQGIHALNVGIRLQYLCLPMPPLLFLEVPSMLLRSLPGTLLLSLRGTLSFGSPHGCYCLCGFPSSLLVLHPPSHLHCFCDFPGALLQILALLFSASSSL